MIELSPAFFFRNNIIDLLHNSIGFSEKKVVFNLDASIALLL